MRKLIISVLLSIFAFVSISQEVTSGEVNCDCPDSFFSKKNNPPLLKQKLNNRDIVVCGYRLEWQKGIILGDKREDGSFYASGYEIFSCERDSMKQIFIVGEYYLDLIVSLQDTLVINRLMPMPQNKNLTYEWTPMIAFRLYKENQSIKTDTIFVFSLEKYNQEFLDHFNNVIISLEEEDYAGQYEGYLIDYTFIKAVKDPDKYSESLKSLGTFDGYLGPIYRDMLLYFDIYYRNKKNNN